ncbi:MAG: hypothetical protein RLZZ271_64 [Pseudomonadota bacterium]|jgi:uncharacterized protein (DUF58 family)
MPWLQVNRRIVQWWMQRHAPRSEVRLHQRNLYILPTRPGWMLGMTLLVLLLASINYQLNLGYVLTFLLAGCAAASAWTCHRNMLGLRLRASTPVATFAGHAAQLEVHIHNPGRQWRYAVSLHAVHTDTEDGVTSDLPPEDSTRVVLTHIPAQRGVHLPPMLSMHTLYPLGIFRVWTLWQPDVRLLVYPAPETRPPALPITMTASGQHSTRKAIRHGEEYEGLRPYRRGDTLKSIAWKKTTPSGALVSKDSGPQQQGSLWLDIAHALTGARESDLQRLCAWILKADAMGLDYGLRLGALEIPPSSGAEHRARCLEALALC